MPQQQFANHDDLKKFIAGNGAAPDTPPPTQQAMTPPPLQAPPQRPEGMPKSWDYGHLPQFLQDGIDKAKMRYIGTTDPKYGTLAAVDVNNPYEVHVADPNTGQYIMDHELTHTLQFLHPEAKFAPVATEGDKYDYGGADGLMKVSGKKQLSDYSIEQTARMVNDYGEQRDKIFKMAKNDLLTAKDLNRWSQVQAAYAPLLRQLGQIGGHKYDEFKADPTKLQDLPEFSDRAMDISHTWAYGELQKANQAMQVAQNNSAPPVAWAKPGPYITQLPAQQEQQFQAWAKANPSLVGGEMGEKADYDVRGRWLAEQKGDPTAKLVRSEFDGKMHASDKWKTPYHRTFSNESIYATGDAPRWKGNQLIDKNGKVVVDETPGKKPAVQPEADWDANDYKAHGMTPPATLGRK